MSFIPVSVKSNPIQKKKIYSSHINKKATKLIVAYAFRRVRYCYEQPVNLWLPGMSMIDL